MKNKVGKRRETDGQMKERKGKACTLILRKERDTHTLTERECHLLKGKNKGIAKISLPLHHLDQHGFQIQINHLMEQAEASEDMTIKQCCHIFLEK